MIGEVQCEIVTKSGWLMIDAGAVACTGARLRHLEAAAVLGGHLVQLAEQVLFGVAREHVAETGLD